MRGGGKVHRWKRKRDFERYREANGATTRVGPDEGENQANSIICIWKDPLFRLPHHLGQGGAGRMETGASHGAVVWGCCFASIISSLHSLRDRSFMFARSVLSSHFWASFGSDANVVVAVCRRRRHRCRLAMFPVLCFTHRPCVRVCVSPCDCRARAF